MFIKFCVDVAILSIFNWCKLKKNSSFQFWEIWFLIFFFLKKNFLASPSEFICNYFVIIFHQLIELGAPYIPAKFQQNPLKNGAAIKV